MDPKIILKNLPLDITNEDCVSLFKSLGAIHSHILGRHNTMCAIARCNSLLHAEKLIGLLHQKVLLGRRLSVEFFEPQPTEDYTDVSTSHTLSLPKKTETVLETSNSKNVLPVIAPLWDSSARFSTMPCYQYPEPNTSIMTNIVRCMFSCPALYTQVLHLMNRLHLPPPFGDCELFPGAHIVCCQSDLAEMLHLGFSSSADSNLNTSLAELQEEAAMDMSSETESEIGSDDSADTGTVNSLKPLSTGLQRRRKKPRSVVKDQVKAVLASILRKAATKRQKKIDPSNVGVGALFDAAEPTKQARSLNLNLPTSLPLPDPSECSNNIVDDNADLQHSVSLEQTFDGFGWLHSVPKDSIQSCADVNEDKWTEKTSVVCAPALPSTQLPETDLITSFQLRKDRSLKHRTDSGADELPCVEPGKPSSSLESIEYSETSEHNESSSSAAGGILTKSLSDLAADRLSPSQRQDYSVFCRGYSRGEPTSRLYVKNLGSSVTETELHRIFGLFHKGLLISDPDYRTVVWPEREPAGEGARYFVRLLTQGRMKGQAFVSLASEEVASQALEATNGLLLHDRPMVVQFGRGAKARVDEKSLIGQG